MYIPTFYLVIKIYPSRYDQFKTSETNNKF